jgi:predicted nucleotidyltransferase
MLGGHAVKLSLRLAVVSDPIVEATRWLQSDEAGSAIDSLCERFAIQLLTLFGSAVDPTVTSPGDLDIAVQGASDDVDVLGLTDALVALTHCDSVDVTVLNRARPVVRAKALCGIGLYEHTSGALARAQMAALGEWRDTAWLRRLDLERLAG